MSKEKAKKDLKKLENELFNEILETTREEYSHQKKFEPFEVYVKRLKHDYFKENDEYLHHLQNGYKIIIDEIAGQLNEKGGQL